ncbi:amino acid ABC transporter substrate-binding protein, PAAT family [Poseidonocella pacifica]|uniref:Amino acid ABC transporter substrate-binding protein, PAAT family n=1 Tax=Poseidonocella pacifica TaxID=871651 RepID=A0A1I0YUF7_9RHOB|nr:transporter substrate-binding domain-containing protein [Poseidonocella pacifica]SFB16851.1 amino acid ABC transporter substrate-binding protein, PAAT family [Poseidonocella pacifica]
MSFKPMSCKLASLGAIAALVATTAAHAEGEPPAEVAPIKDAYKAGIDGTFAPHAFPSLDGGIQGFNVDIASAMAEKLGVEIEIIAGQYTGLFPALHSETFDYIAAPTTVTEERSKTLLFTEGFMETNFGFAAKPGSGIASVEDLRGKTVTANKGSLYETWLTERAEEMDMTVLTFGTSSDALEAVTSGRADASMAGMTATAWAGKMNPNLEFAFQINTGLSWALPFRREDYATRNLFDSALECLKIDGTMAALSEKWFGITPEEGELIVTPSAGYGTPGFEGYQPDEHEASCDFG